MDIEFYESTYNKKSRTLVVKGKLVDKRSREPFVEAKIEHCLLDIKQLKIKPIHAYKLDMNGVFDISLKVDKGQGLLFAFVGYLPILFQLDYLIMHKGKTAEHKRD